MITIQASFSPGEVRAVALDDGQLIDYALSRPGRPDGMGDVHRGRVLARVPAMAGAFVALVDAEGFLPDSAGAAGLTDGQGVRVRVVRAAQGGKGPRLMVDGLCEPGAPMLIARGPGALERLAARFPQASIQLDDPALLSSWGATPLPGFDDATESALDELAHSRAALPGGMIATFSPTPALVAIDLDMASATGGRAVKATAQVAANRLALPALARQIRLRNLSGAIVVDLAGMKAAKRATLAPVFAAALAEDPLRPRFLGFTAMGLAEILRPRTHPPLHELLAGPYAVGIAGLRRLVREAAAEPAALFALRAPPEVCAALDADGIAKADLARRTGRPLVLRADPALPPGMTVLERMQRA